MLEIIFNEKLAKPAYNEFQQLEDAIEQAVNITYQHVFKDKKM